MAKQKLNPNQISAALTAGSNGSYTIMGGVQICTGVAYAGSGGTWINFPRAFSATPTVVLALQDPNQWGVWIRDCNASSVLMVCSYTAAPLAIDYMAIGPA